jgi:hypothetical protein
MIMLSRDHVNQVLDVAICTITGLAHILKCVLQAMLLKEILYCLLQLAFNLMLGLTVSRFLEMLIARNSLRVEEFNRMKVDMIRFVRTACP